MIMKKSLLFSFSLSITLLLLMPGNLRSQVCVTLFQGTDFGLDDQYNSIVDIETDRLGNMWFVLYYPNIATYCEVGKFDGGAVWAKVEDSFLPERTPLDLAVDKKDSVWIATKKGIGIVHILSLQGRTMTPANSDLPEANVTAIAVDSSNTKWIGFSSGAVASYDGIAFTVYKEWSNAPVRTIEIAADSSVWVGLNDSPGIVRFKNGKWTPNSTVKSISAITADKWGRVMVASGDSMIVYAGAQISSVHSVAGNLVQDIAVGQAGRIWASSNGALLLRSDSRFVPYSSSNSAVPLQLSGPVKFDRENRLWFAYKWGGGEALTATGFLYRTAPQTTAVITADKPGLVFCYGDSLTLKAEPDKVSYVWPDGSNADSYRVYDAETVEVAVEGDNRCFYYDTVRVNVQKVFEEEKVCAVSVDTSQLNIIIWEKTPGVGTASYNIYRELAVKDSFEWIGNLPADDLSVFEDPGVDPTEQAVRYKISSVDTCGNESGRSFYHQTLHLSMNKGALPGDINLIWNDYVGISFSSYLIYRGSSPDSMEVIATLSSNFTTYTDHDVYDTFYYRIAIPLPEECSPTGKLKKGTGPYTHALSNLDDNKKLLTFTDELPAATEIRTYPNPFTEVTRMEFPYPGAAGYVLRIYSLAGQLVRETAGIKGSEFFIRRGNLEPGYYLFELSGERTFRGKFVVR
jgi:sugar lactone lactonase YvrE